MNDRPEATLLLGVPRSGTTLLRRFVNAHPRFHCPAETNVFAACGRFLREDRIIGETLVGVLSGLAFAGMPEEETLRRLREFAFGFHRDLARGAGKPRWASKTAFDVFYLNEILGLCGDHAAYVCILRHGLDVVCSLEELCAHNGTFLPEIHEYVRRWATPQEAFAHLWVHMTERLLELRERRPERVFVCRYEDLVADPRKTMQAVFEFLGESPEGWSPELALRDRGDVGFGDWKAHQRGSVDEASSVGRWRTVPPTEITLLAPILNNTLLRAGYAALEAGPLPSREEARRRYQVGLMVGNLERRERRRKG